MRPASSCETTHWPRLSAGSDSSLPLRHFRSKTCSDEYITLSIAQNRLFALCSIPPFGFPNVSTIRSFVSALKSPSVSFISQRFGGSPTRTPCSSTFRARGPESLSANTVFLSITPSPSVSSSTLTRSSGSFESRPDMSGRNVGISTTHRRPSASKSIRIGESMSGSEATSSTWKPGGSEKVFISSCGDRATEVGI